jgi:hypothetical protein
MWVSIQNSSTAPKNIFGMSTTLVNWASTGELTLGITKAWKFCNDVSSALTVGGVWQVERQGNFVALIWNGVGVPTGWSITEGDWIAIDPTVVDYTYPANGTMSSVNRGLFRIVRVEDSTHTLWIENQFATEEVSSVDVAFFDSNSTFPGDTMTLGSNVWGSANMGAWSISRLDITDQFKFWVDTSSKSPVAISSVGPLGVKFGLMQVYEHAPSRLIKHVIGVSPNGNTIDIKLSTTQGSTLISAGFGSIITALDKLQFPTNIIKGIDGYVHYTGLIAQATLELYGDDSHSDEYPGIVAAQGEIETHGLFKKRLMLSLQIQTVTGVTQSAIRMSVQSSVASFVNTFDGGTPIPLSGIIGAAQSVNGVFGVVVVSPTYGIGNSNIPVGASEKLVILDPQHDITVSFGV